MGKTKYKISGMNCSSCATMIQMDIEDAGYKCNCSYYLEELEIEGEHDIKKITDILKGSGYDIISK